MDLTARKKNTKNIFPPRPGVPSLTNDAPCQLFVVPDLKHQSLPASAQEAPVFGGERITEGGDGGVREARGGVWVPTLWLPPRMVFDQL